MWRFRKEKIDEWLDRGAVNIQKEKLISEKRKED